MTEISNALFYGLNLACGVLAFLVVLYFIGLVSVALWAILRALVTGLVDFPRLSQADTRSGW